jgi:hypothetical protein
MNLLTLSSCIASARNNASSESRAVLSLLSYHGFKMIGDLEASPGICLTTMLSKFILEHHNISVTLNSSLLPPTVDHQARLIDSTVSCVLKLC